MYKNEEIKREFYNYLRGAEGFTEDSVESFAGAISQWQIFFKNEDFANFNSEKALSFRDWLQNRKAQSVSGSLSHATQANYLRRIKRFFLWLADHPHYRKISKNEAKFLRLSKKDNAIVRLGTTKKIPSLEEVREVIESIVAESEIDNRDRAIICLALITGMRISALISLKMSSFDKKNRTLDQNPGNGVKTKNSKRILTTFIPIGWEDPEKFFIEWFEYLESKGCDANNPIFPVTSHCISSERISYSKVAVGNEFWKDSSSARKIFQKRFNEAGLPYFHPHSFRHLAVNIISKTRLTEEEKKAFSVNLGHANVGTTFGSYGSGKMTDEQAVDIIKKFKENGDQSNHRVTDEEWEFFQKIFNKMRPMAFIDL